MISTFTAFIDSNVYYGARLRSLILFLAGTGLFRPRWSNDVHREWITNLLSNRPDLVEADLQKTRQAMDRAVPDCLASGYQPLIEGLTLPDRNDRHILAAAISCKAQAIVTFNLQDFTQPALDPFGIHLKHPDEFLLDIFNLDEDSCMEAVQADIEHYVAPPLTIDAYIASLEKASVPHTAAFLRERKIIFTTVEEVAAANILSIDGKLDDA